MIRTINHKGFSRWSGHSASRLLPPPPFAVLSLTSRRSLAGGAPRRCCDACRGAHSRPRARAAGPPGGSRGGQVSAGALGARPFPPHRPGVRRRAPPGPAGRAPDARVAKSNAGRGADRGSQATTGGGPNWARMDGAASAGGANAGVERPVFLDQRGGDVPTLNPPEVLAAHPEIRPSRRNTSAASDANHETIMAGQPGMARGRSSRTRRRSGRKQPLGMHLPQFLKLGND